MTYITRLALWALVLTVSTAEAQNGVSDFESELEIVNESYFSEEPYLSKKAHPRTVTRGQAAWTPFNIRRGFSTVHLMNEQACRSFLGSLREHKGTACMNIHTGRVFYSSDFIGPRMP
nr:hypothetical protein [Paracoccus saliphilus]